MRNTILELLAEIEHIQLQCVSGALSPVNGAIAIIEIQSSVIALQASLLSHTKEATQGRVVTLEDKKVA
jgi:hypothetical protein